MKVFVSWSGERSRLVAEALHTFLQDVIQALEPWISVADIEKGARWHTEISAQLEEAQVGIVCLTRDNMESPWLLFEAGALSKFQQGSYVCTLLLDLDLTDVREPLAQFQGTRANREDVWKLTQTLNSLLTNEKLTIQQLERAFNRAWPDFEKQMSKIAPSRTEKRLQPDLSKMLEEVVGYVRAQSREVSEGQRTGAIVAHLSSDEIISLGKILSANKNLVISSITETQIEFQDGTHGTVYKVNRRALDNFLIRLRRDVNERKKKR